MNAFDVRRFGPEFRRWVNALDSLGGCAAPVMLMGHTLTRDASGVVVHAFRSEDLPFGVLMLPCRNRREAVCLPCSLLHNGDSFQIVRSGLSGGKGVPTEVAEHPRAFVTVTAPSFGPVHRDRDGEVCRARRDKPRCPHGRALFCGARHAAGDPAVGSPLCGECYDWAGLVVWNASAGGLWWRYVKELGRELVRLGGLPVTAATVHASLRVSYARVVEFQRRGVAHFHAVVRIDGPGGPGDPAPAWVTSALLVEAAHAAGPRVSMPVERLESPGRIGLGVQLDAQEIGAAGADGMTDQAAASYLAKYITKDDGRGLVLPRRLLSETGIEHAQRGALVPHARALMHTAWLLGGLEIYAPLRLRAWAHQLGFRGNVVTKSRMYSTTYGALRKARTEHRARINGVEPIEGAGLTRESHWRFVAQGLSPALREIADGLAEGTRMRKAPRPEWLDPAEVGDAA